MMPLNWYLLNMTGSLTKTNTYVRKYTEGSERSGVISTTPKAPKNRGASFKITELDRISAASVSSRKSNRSGGDTKVAKNSPTIEAGPLKIKLKPKKEPVVQDSPQMRQFFDEVRQRELKDYYRQMRAAERDPKETLECPHCGLPKRGKGDLTANIYCRGDESLKGKMVEDCDGLRDLTWLWNSSTAYSHLALSCECGGGGSTT
ncbi:uncharacterized protein LOC108136784 [Drosophila elegans]|uniref:uncharacterized protein LOC108136784 n=1 Tax=Drosophila elegans TaxID=30023 RepID=UPI001BC8437A|nr:uncharacterized protein LOC108136784 [Drosophila elegans]